MNIVTLITKSGVRQLKETNCWALSIHTEELSEKQLKDLIKMDSVCTMLLSDTGISNEQVKAVEATEIVKEVKQSRSQQVRFQLKLLWELEGMRGDKDDYYNTRMDSIIGKLKDKVRERKNGN
jgi:hypothetical protein|tara:strand:- start:11257 stop:11625 length:369 start_codon:yes stop_codon:yes gene_type:complete